MSFSEPISNICKDWKVNKVKREFAFSKGLPITKADLELEGLPVINYGQIHSKKNPTFTLLEEFLRYVGSSKTSESSRLSHGDFVFADTSEDYEGVGNCVLIDRTTTLFAGYHTIVLKAKNPEFSPYFAFLFQTDYWRYQLRSKVYGIKVFSITQNLLRDCDVFIPPLNVQRKIVSFLKDQCSRLDHIISLEEQSIEKLKAYKQSLITEVVTKGLDPHAEMKDSGVDWIGRVPKHWKIRQLRFVGRCQNGISKGAEFFGAGFPFVSYSDVYKNWMLPMYGSGLIKSTPDEQDLFSVKNGDIFFTRTSETIEEIGLTSVCRNTIKDAVFAGFLIRVRPFKDIITTGYSTYYFRSDIHRAFFVKEMHLVTRASLSQELLKRLPVLLPPSDEQRAIGKYLDKKCSMCDQAIELKQKKIAQLQSYKKSLIYEVVTGKREVL